jgi:hypothetical protein
MGSGTKACSPNGQTDLILGAFTPGIRASFISCHAGFTMVPMIMYASSKHGTAIRTDLTETCSTRVSRRPIVALIGVL